jgi:hypothetical protein
MMFQSIQVDEIFDLNVYEDHPAYWLAQLRKADWLELLKFVGAKSSMSSKKRMLTKAALEHFEFEVCETRAQVWKVWQSMPCEQSRRLIVQFRHSETDWTRGVPEFIQPDKGEPLGFVNIAARLICKVK